MLQKTKSYTYIKYINIYIQIVVWFNSCDILCNNNIGLQMSNDERFSKYKFNE